MRMIDPEARAVRKRYDDEVEAVEREQGAALAKIVFAAEGSNMPPDATSTLRLSYGAVRGFVEDGRGIVPAGTKVPFFTTIGGAFDHANQHGNKSPYQLPATWTKAKSRLRLDTPLNMVSTPGHHRRELRQPGDQHEGRDRRHHFRWKTFSRCPGGLPTTTRSHDRSAWTRAGIIEALRNIYGANALVDELTARRSRRRRWARPDKAIALNAPARHGLLKLTDTGGRRRPQSDASAISVLERPQSFTKIRGANVAVSRPLRDRVRMPVHVLFVGINPASVLRRLGHHFAGYSNRFWRLLCESGLVPEHIGTEDDARLPEWGYGADESHPTRHAWYRHAAAGRIRGRRPRIAAKNQTLAAEGRGLCRRHAVQGGVRPACRHPVVLGLQPDLLEGARVFVLPNPSGGTQISPTLRCSPPSLPCGATSNRDRYPLIDRLLNAG
jgi:G:T/U-mismatch repair DNA glycosylase